jgi:hypothetical protein
MTNEYSIAVLLPTRGRTDPLSRSVISLFDRCTQKDRVLLILGFDDDDVVGVTHFTENLQPWLDENGVNYTAMSFQSMGYAGLNRYYNEMAKETNADWYFVWNDDAVMQTAGWDQIIQKYDGQFRLLKIHTHNEHPYSIFPIIPKAWFDVFGHFSRHQMIDAELSHMAYLLDLIEIVDIHAIHERADLVGNKPDETDKKRIRFEGNPNNPYDFFNPNMYNQRMNDTETLSSWMKEQKLDITFWENVKAGTQDPWEKMRANDPNKQTVQTTIVK